MPLDFKNWKTTATSGFFFAAGAALGWKAVTIVLGWIGMLVTEMGSK